MITKPQHIIKSHHYPPIKVNNFIDNNLRDIVVTDVELENNWMSNEFGGCNILYMDHKFGENMIMNHKKGENSTINIITNYENLMGVVRDD